MGKVWATVTLRRPANVVFQAMVRGAALSGLEALVLSDTERARLDSTIRRYARKLLRGAACHKTHTDGGVLYRAVPDGDVCRLLRIVPSKLEVTIRRLQYWQAVARRADSHSAVLAAVFGTMRYDARDTVCADGSIADSANPWALQLAEDVASLLVLDTASERLWGIGHRFFSVFTSYRHDFLQIDSSELRAAFFSAHIPPPGTSPPTWLRKLLISKWMMLDWFLFVIVQTCTAILAQHTFDRSKLWPCTFATLPGACMHRNSFAQDPHIVFPHCCCPTCRGSATRNREPDQPNSHAGMRATRQPVMGTEC